MKRSNRKLSRKRDIPEKDVERGLSPSEREEIKQMKEGKAKDASREEGKAKDASREEGKAKDASREEGKAKYGNRNREKEARGKSQQMALKSK